MLHLFDKVYISSDSIIDANFDRYVISKQHGLKMYEPLEKVSYGKLLGYAYSIDDVLTNKRFAAFLWELKKASKETNKKIIIYIDDESFLKFMVLWYKSIFKNPSFEHTWFIIKSYLAKERYLKNWRDTSTATNSEIFPSITKENFSNLFFSNEEFVKEDKFFKHLIPSISFEFLLVSYIINGSYKEELKKSISNILERSLKEIAIEIKHSYIKNKNKRNFPDIAKDEAFFTNSTFFTSKAIGSVSNLYSNVDIKRSTDEDFTKFKKIAKTIFSEWDEFKPDSDVIKIIDFLDIIRKKNISDEDLESIITFERYTKGLNRIFSSADEEKINLYFLDYVLNSNKEDLLRYALV
jgi:hypothetical protein